MPIQNMPAALQPIIQQGFLEREFQDALRARLGFRAIADRESFANGIGETITKTRAGLKEAATTPLNPAANTNMDNGLTPSSASVEQYTLGINQYGDTQDLNMVTSRVAITGQFLLNANINGEQAARTLDILARDALYGSYLGGNTRVRTTLGAPAITVAVDDIRGFRQMFVNSVLTGIGPANPMIVTVGAGLYFCIGASADGTNVSTAPDGISGTLSFDRNVSVADATVGVAVTSAVAPQVLRPNARASTATLKTGDTLDMKTVLAAVALLRSNTVPTADGGLYNCYLDDKQMLGLFADEDFKLLFRGAYASTQYKQGQIIELLGVRFIPTNLAPQQILTGLPIHRAIVCGQGALIEGDYASTGYSDIGGENADIRMVDDICMVTRAPLDRLQQIVAQSWYWIGGFAVPTDMTADARVIPTATNSYYKRGVVLESL